MIRVNLLREGPRTTPSVRGRGGISVGEVLLFVFALIGLLVGVGWWYVNSSTIEELDAKIAELEEEKAALEPFIKKSEELRKKSEELKRKISIIKELKRKQVGPVKIMDAISRAVPDHLWLDGMSVVGSTIELRGKAFNENAVANFIDNLKDVTKEGELSESIEFMEPQLNSLVFSGGERVYNFVMKVPFKIKYPGGEGEEEEMGEEAL